MRTSAKFVSSLKWMLGISLIALMSAPLSAAVVYNLPGNAQYDGWDQLHTGRLTGYGNAGTYMSAWPAALVGNKAGSNGGATFNKQPGGSGYAGVPSSNGIYTFFGEGKFVVEDATPVAGLKNVVFQLDASGGSPAPALLGLPVLTLYDQLNVASAPISATYTGQAIGTHSVTDPTTNQVSSSTNYLYQWDLSAYSGTISKYTITWTQSLHSFVHGADLSSSDTFVQVVPEPGKAGLALMGLAIAVLRRKRPQAKR